MKSNNSEKQDVTLEDKILWTIKEAAAYSTIGEGRLREMAKQKDCPFSVRVGRKICIKRKEFEEFISNAKEI